MTDQLGPLTVYDIRDTAAWARTTDDKAHHERLLDWMRAHGMNPLNTYRLEIYLIDCPSARVYEYALNTDGKKYVVGDDIARCKPYEVILSSLPPEPEGT